MLKPSVPAIALSVVLPAVFVAAPASAQGPEWSKSFHVRARMIEGPMPDKTRADERLAGVHVVLDQGWKTYWRNPGDAGIAPSFDFKGSSNLRKAAVLWPAPHRLRDDYGVSYGYKNEVVFPIVVTPKDASRPVDLRLQLNYGICKDICVPAEATLSETLPAGGIGDTSDSALLARYMARVPGPVSHDRRPSLERLDANLTGKSPSLIVVADFPKGATRGDVFIEAGELYLPPPEPLGPIKNGERSFSVDLSGVEDVSSLKGRKITLTLVSDDAQSEVVHTIK